MNIVILSPKDIAGLNHGAAIRIYNFAKSLARFGNEVTVICIPYFRGGRFLTKIHEENLTKGE